MTDPTSTPVAAAGAAWLIAMVLAYLGIDYYALFAGLTGVLGALDNKKEMSLQRVVLTAIVMTLSAAVLGQGLAELINLKARAVVMLFSLIFGAAGQAGVQAGVTALLDALKAVVKRVVGGKSEGGTP